MLNLFVLFSLWPTLARAATAAERADEASRIQMTAHVNVEHLPELTQIRARRIPYVDVQPAGPVDARLIYDRGAPADARRIARALGVVTEVGSAPRLRIFLHPTDTYYRREIMNDLIRAGDRVVASGVVTGYASASRSIFVPAGRDVVMLKMSTNDVNGFYQDKVMSLSDGVQSVLMNSFLARELPGEFAPEPLAVKISDRFSYVVRTFTDVNDHLRWIPGYAFGITDLDSRAFAGQRDEVMRRWVRLSTRLNVFVDVSFNHLQNILVGLNRATGQVERVRLIDLNDVAPLTAELDGLRRRAGFDPAWPLDLKPKNALSLNTFLNIRGENLPELAAIRDEHLPEDLEGLPASRVDRFLRGERSIEPAVCDRDLTRGMVVTRIGPF